MTGRIAGVELGGTKCIAVLEEGGIPIARRQVATATPDATLTALAAELSAWHAAAPLAALGIASFGPLHLDPVDPAFGRMGATPKPGWRGADVRGALAVPGVPTGFDTDVAGAALAEGRWGAARGCSDHVYVTIGTGVGVGIVAAGRLVHGRGHPEAGHVRVRRVAGDPFAGSCVFHGDCLEGLVAGPALAARTGLAGDLIPDAHPVWAMVAVEVAEALATLMLVLAPQRIVLGGGVFMRRRHLLPQILAATAERLGDYLADGSAASLARIIVPAALGEDAGPRGAIALALDALQAVAPS